jgi:hypothetical protein
MTDEKPVEKAVATVGGGIAAANLVLSAIGFIKEFFITFITLFAQSQTIKAKKLQDEIDYMKMEKKLGEENVELQAKKQNTDPVAGINEFLQKRDRNS